MNDFLRATTIRAVRTAAQVLVGYLSAATVISDVDWGVAVSATAVATLLSALTSVATGLPEAE